MAVMKNFIIKLEDIESSEALATDCIQSGEKHDLLITPFNGIYGIDAIKLYEKKFRIRTRGKIKKERIGVRGCFLSHYSLWVNCIETNIPFLILEHDAFILNSLPDNILDLFDEFLLLDPYNKMKDSYVSNHNIAKDFSIEEYHNPRKTPKYGVSHDYVMGLQGYIIKPKAAIKLVDDVKKNGYLPADIQCNKGIINIQTIYPAVVSINPKFYGNKPLMKQESTTHKIW